MRLLSSVKSDLRNSMLPMCTPSISCIKTYLIISMQIWLSNPEYLTLFYFLSLCAQGPTRCSNTIGIQFLFLWIVWTEVTKCIHYISVPSLSLVQCEVLSRSSINTYRCLSSLIWLDRNTTFSFAEFFYPSLHKCPCWGLRTDYGGCLRDRMEMQNVRVVATGDNKSLLYFSSFLFCNGNSKFTIFTFF